jgi:probable O-glycosylation ligase (exosortase A-associated)
MRDIAVTLAVFGTLPFILRWPWVGILVWTWLGFMSPHRMAWGFSTTMPFAMIVALVTLIAILFSRDPKRFSRDPGIVLMVVFLAWMFLTTLNAHYPELAWEQFNKIWKIFLMIFVATLVINTRERMLALVAVITLSIAFFGVKGGVFTLLTGGGFHVQGPPNSFIGGNNELGLALVMTLPLLFYGYLTFKRFVLRAACIGAIGLTVVATLGTQSRGALLGLVAMGAFIWLKSRYKLQIAILIAVAVLVLVPVMPESWFDRMSSIRDYEHDGSAQGRLNAWRMAFNLASNEPMGGGFETFQPAEFARYSPIPRLTLDAHSIYFEVLGEHGFPGLAIFLALLAVTWVGASRTIRRCKGDASLRWLADLMAMVQVSLLSYLTAGAFLGMAYFDYFYNLVLIVAMAKGMVVGATVRSGAAGAKRRPARMDASTMASPQTLPPTALPAVEVPRAPVDRHRA